MSALSDRIFATQDIPSELVHVDAWNIDIEVRGMTGAERTRIMDLAMTDDGEVKLQTVYPEIVISTAFDPATGEQVFAPGDSPNLLAKSALALDALALVGMRLSGFTQEAADKAGKDSSATPTDGSSSN